MSPGELRKVPLSRLHPGQSILESLEVRPRHQCFSSTPGCAPQFENDTSQKRSCHGTWAVGWERPRVGEVLTLQGATDWAALSTSCLFPSPRLHTLSWSQAGAGTEADAQLHSQSPDNISATGVGGRPHPALVLGTPWRQALFSSLWTSESEGIWANEQLPLLTRHPGSALASSENFLLFPKDAPCCPISCSCHPFHSEAL